MARRKRPASPGVSVGAPWIDTLQNLLSGLGTDKDKMTGSLFIFQPIAQQQLEFAYRGDWIARKVVNIPADDATREWRSWQADNTDIELIEDTEDRLQLPQKVLQAMRYGRLFGGGALLIGVDQGKLSDPLDPTRVRKDGLKFVHAVSRWELSAGPVDWTINSPFYGEPQYYTRTLGDKEQIHPSRVIRFLGNPIPITAMASDGWSDSVLQVVSDTIHHVGTVTGSVAQLVNEAKIDVISVPDFLENAGNNDYATKFKERFSLANTAKSVFNTLVLDKEETWQRIQTQFQGLPDVLKMYLLIASGAADIPVTRMLGQSPTGLSATGESDIRNYYDSIKHHQHSDIAPAMKRLDDVLIASALGKFNPSIYYEWNSLWQMDDKQRADIAKTRADVFKIDSDTGVIPATILQKARVNQLIEDGTYPGLEIFVEEAGGIDALEEDVPNPQGTPPAGTQPGPDQTLQPNEPGLRNPGSQSPGTVPAADRRKRVADATLRSLYVRRDLINVEALRAWANGQGLKLVDDPHVTIAYSRKAVDWSKAGEASGQDDQGRIRIAPGGMRAVEKFGANSIVLIFTSSVLSFRHVEINHKVETSWDYPEYQPHVTIQQVDQPVDVKTIEPYRGELIFGPEIFEEAKP